MKIYNALLDVIISHSQKVLFRLVICLVVVPLPVWASPLSTSETRLQVAFIYNFTQFIEWPASQTNTDFRLCVLNAKGEMREQFSRLNRKKVGHQKIKMLYLKSSSSVAKLRSCQMIFQAEPRATTSTQLLPLGVVLVAYEPDGNDPNVSIAIKFKQLNHATKLKFSINRAAVSLAGVRFSSQLLELAVDD